jgi:PIN domain nuclease of toxin-antitoxin system
MREYVTDTHPLLWNLFIPKRLGRAAFDVFREVDRGNAKLYVPAIVISEMLMVVEKSRIPNVTMQDLLDEISLMEFSQYHELLPLLPKTAVASRTLTDIPDIFDRLIVAEALRLGLSLITHDSVITISGAVSIVWD